MSYRLNLADEEEQSFEALPAGTYLCTIFDHEDREASETSKNPGAPMIRWQFSVADGQEHANRRFFYYTLLLPGKMGNLKALLRATGRYADSEIDGAEFMFNAEDLYGTKVKVVVNRQKYQGDFTNSVKRVMRADASEESGSLLP